MPKEVPVDLKLDDFIVDSVDPESDLKTISEALKDHTKVMTLMR